MRKSFTMVEMLVVLVIIAIIGGLAIPAFSKSRDGVILKNENSTIIERANAVIQIAKSQNRDATISDWFFLAGREHWDYSIKPAKDLASGVYSTSPNDVVVSNIYINNYSGFSMKSKTGGCLYGYITKSGDVSTWYKDNDQGAACNPFEAVLGK